MKDDPTPTEKRRRLIMLAVAVLIGALILLVAVEWGSLSTPDAG